MDAKQMFGVWKEVFGKWRYLLLALLIALFFYLLNVLISGWKSLAGFYSSAGFLKTMNLLFVLFMGFSNSITMISFISLIIISLMLGMLFSMLVYKHHIYALNGDKRLGIFGGIGAFLAALVPGCAACGIGFASILGLSAGILSFLPYDGIELSLIAMVILIVTIFKTTKNMYVCMVSPFALAKNEYSTKLKGNKFPVNASKSLKENKFSIKRARRHI